jgi:chromosome segregation ATPase
MSNQAVVDDIRRLAVTYQSMVVAADTLEKIGSLEQAAAEAQAARDKAVAELDTVRAELLAAQDEAKQVSASTEVFINQINAQAQSIINQASVDAALIVEKAKQDALVIALDANVATQASIVAATSQLSTLQAKVNELTDEVAAQEKAKADAEASTSEAQAKYDAIKAQIAKMAA